MVGGASSEWVEKGGEAVDGASSECVEKAKPAREVKDQSQARGEQERKRLRNLSFIDRAVQGGALPRSNVSSSKLGALIGLRPLHGPAAMTRSGLICTSGWP